MTQSETSNEGFAIEHKADGAPDFARVGWVGGAGTTLKAQHYDFTVSNLPPGIHRFRLRQIDLDGAFSFSPVVELIAVADGLTASVSPQPVRGRALFRIATEHPRQIEASLYDALGRRVAQLYAGHLAGSATLPLPSDLGAGLYVLRVVSDNYMVTRSVVVAH